MKFQKLGEDLYTPLLEDRPLKNVEEVKFNYFLSSRIQGKVIDLDITSKIFDLDKIYIKKSCYRVRMGEIEQCVKSSIVEHMRQLGVKEYNIPKSLLNPKLKKHLTSKINKRIFTD